MGKLSTHNVFLASGADQWPKFRVAHYMLTKRRFLVLGMSLTMPHKTAHFPFTQLFEATVVSRSIRDNEHQQLDKSAGAVWCS
jgi:hypothetical protein